ncbi:hypothetical protein [Longimicrobium terrae]|uniref:Uncharacterized protein n=1 Tax=Longimicrobium terrae TaxID=1639882 RepID=A0A841GWZ9_9BACT|nr:hypothetical protein [Longimicrobium terrae]MBB4634731.1 hypothetical protein [Longimicrobium terrae]MBB6069126.1 hypothetical protein [Longimicrobium terrae]NNC32057.1 hypothetical protein [Longimicrobium terrae]
MKPSREVFPAGAFRLGARRVSRNPWFGAGQYTVPRPGEKDPNHVRTAAAARGVKILQQNAVQRFPCF